jgi:hypothetical protein
MEFIIFGQAAVATLLVAMGIEVRNMQKDTKQRQEEVFEKYPFLKEGFDERCEMRREEIIDDLLKSDANYRTLTRQRADTSQVVLKILSERGMADLFEAYSDAVYAEEIYEGEMIYKSAFIDAVEMMARQKGFA